MMRRALILAGLAGLAAATPANAGAPRIASASSLDRDADGHVDSVRVLFSGKVRGKGSFAVAGMRVASAGKARGRGVMLKLAERPDCDLGLLPKVTYRSGLKRKGGRRVPRSSVNMEKRSRPAPRLTCAVTSDTDGDGHVDGLMLTWSKRVRGGSAAAFGVQGYTVRGVGRARGRNLSLQLAERDKPDSGATPAVTHTRVRRGGVRGRGGQALSGSLRTTRDGVAPVLSSARTADSDANGKLDSLFIAFSEPVESVPGGAHIEGAQVTGAVPSGDELALGLDEGPLGTGDRPVISYGAGEVTDLAGNSAAPADVPADDGAGPLVTAARTEDRTGDGQLDTLTVTFSEPVSHAADGDGSYPLEVPGYGIAGVGAANGSTVELALTQAGSPDTGVRPGLRYVRGAGSPVADATGNEALEATFAGTTDGAPPRLVGATTLDADEDGAIDRIRYRFSEPVSHAASAAAFSAAGLTTLAPQAASGTSIDVTVTEAGSSNTGLTPGVGYTNPGSGPVSDPAGNRAPSVAGVQATDGAGPVVVDGSTGDLDADHRIDTVTVTMSEPVTYPGDSSAPFAIGAQDYAVESVSAAASSSFTVTLEEPADPDTGGAPDISYSTGGQLRDLAGVEAVARTYSGRVRDTLPPFFVAAETADADGNGRLDRVDLRYSEDVQGGTSTAPFSVTGRTLTGIEFSGPRARIVFSEAGSPDTDEQPSASYTPPGSPAERVTDVPEGAGDTADEAAGQALIQADDNAGAAVVDAVTGDVAGPENGKLDRISLTFSEPITHAAEATGPFSIGLSGGHVVASISAASGDQVTVNVAEASAADGGSKPSITVDAPNLITDAAANPANTTPFNGTEDGVRPLLATARLGEDVSGSCAHDPPQNGRVDCLHVVWSEPVMHAANPTLAIGGGFTASGTTPAQSGSALTDVPLVEGGTPDRDRVASVGYTAGAAVPVFDEAGNEALTTTPVVNADAACNDDPFEANDLRDIGNPPAPASYSARVCSLDQDWFLVVPESDDSLHLMMDTLPGDSFTLEVWDGSGGTALATVPTGGSGNPVTLNVPGLTDPAYWLRVAGAGVADEGEYCVDTRFEVGDTCLGGGGDPL